MLNLENFETSNDRLFYFGENHYSISQHNLIRTSYMLCVAKPMPEEPGAALEVANYTFSTLSAAIAAIEALESGETI